jgi:protocatechuate 4,5-dioxygenase alpha chain
MIGRRFIFGNAGRTLPLIQRKYRRQNMADQPQIPGTTLFDGRQARKGYALNRMCFSFNELASRQAFLADEEAYMRRYGLNQQQADAVRARNVLQMIAAGGNAYYLAKLAGIFHLDMQDIGAQQTGMTKAEFQALLRSHA